MKFTVRGEGTDWIYDYFSRPSDVTKFLTGREKESWIVGVVFDSNQREALEQSGDEWMLMDWAAEKWTAQVENDYRKAMKRMANRESYRRRKVARKGRKLSD